MRDLRSLALLAAFAAFTAAAPAATLTCTNTLGQPNTTLVGYNFDVSVATSTGGGGGGSAGKATTSLVTQFALSSGYPAIYEIATEGRHSSQCVLAESYGNGVSSTITLSDVLFSELKLLSGNYYTSYTPGPVVELTLVYSKIAIAVN